MIGGGGGYALPTETDALTVKLAKPVRAGRIWIEEVTFQWLMDQTTNRTYRGSGGEDMEAARYYATTVPDLGFDIDVGLLTNAKSKFIKRAVNQIVAAATKYIATIFVFGEKDPAHKGIGWPLSEALMLEEDANIRPRGFAGIVRALATENVTTTEVVFPQYFSPEGGGEVD